MTITAEQRERLEDAITAFARGALVEANDLRALLSAFSTVSARADELQAENERLRRDLVEVVIPLEALRLSGKGFLSDAVWEGVLNSTNVARQALDPRHD